MAAAGGKRADHIRCGRQGRHDECPSPATTVARKPGGAITAAISWRAAFVFQALIIVIIVLLARGVTDPLPADPARPFDTVGAILSAVGLVVLVGGIMAADQNLALMAGLIVAGALVLAGFFAWIRGRERAGKEALLSTGLFRNRTSNLALATQNVQWAVLLGTSFVVSAYLQVVRHYDAIQTGVIFTPPPWASCCPRRPQGAGPGGSGSAVARRNIRGRTEGAGGRLAGSAS
jgi:hypothetical protein